MSLREGWVPLMMSLPNFFLLMMMMFVLLGFQFKISSAQKIKSHLACARPDHARLTKAQEYK